ncbi:hypothetical protein Tco_1151320, partial [Tanacetum coccineum]
MEHASKQQLPEQSSKPFDQAARAEFDQKEILFHMMRKNKYYEKHPTHQLVYDALMQSLILDEDEMEKAKTVESPTQMKRHHDDRDQDPPTGPYQGLKKRKKIKDDKPSKKPTLAGSFKGTTQISAKIEFDDGPEQSWLNDLANVEKPLLTFDDLMSTPIDFSTFAMNRLKISKLTKADLVGQVYNLLKETCKSCVELKYNIEECYRALFDQLEWNNPEGNRCPYDLSKPLPLHESQGRLTVPANFFFNNDLEYLRRGSTDRKYMALTIKIKATKYNVEGIKDMGPKRQRFYGYVINRVSMHDVYSTMRILSVTSVTVDKWYGYGYLKEIVVRRVDRKLYMFMEGDFPRLHLNEIEDMLLLVKKLNISKPRMRDVDLSRRALYTTLSEPLGVICEDKLKMKRLMRTDEFYKFSDGTLASVRNTLDQMLKNLRLSQNPRDLPRDIPLDRIEVL